MKKMKGVIKVFLLVSLAIVFAISITGHANAQLTYYFGIDTMFGAPQWGGVAPPGTWATATFIDVDANNVQLTLNVTNNITAAESFGEFYFNYKGDATDLYITAVDVSDVGGWSVDLNDPTTTADDIPTFKADGDGIYDIVFDLPPPPGSPGSKFQDGETLIYNINYTGITASDFDELATPDGGMVGPFYAAAKLQGIPCTTNPLDPDYDTCWNSENMGSTSAWAAGVVPEPVSSTLFLIGGTFLAGRRFLRRKK